MRSHERSKLANCDRRIQPTIATNSPVSNGKKRLAGRNESSTRVRPRVEGPKNPRAGGFPEFLEALEPLGISLANTEHLLSSTTTAHQPEFLDSLKGRGRRSTALRNSEVENIVAAAVYTVQIQLPLNRHTTIHFEAAGISDPVPMIGNYMHLAGDWLRTQGATFAYIWVRENGDHKGEHVHIAMHVPPHLAKRFAKRERGWRKRLGIERKRGACHSTPIGRTYLHAFVGTQYGSDYPDDLKRLIGYLVKGAEPKVAKARGLVRVEPGGTILGKRVSISENINRTARQRAHPLK